MIQQQFDTILTQISDITERDAKTIIEGGYNSIADYITKNNLMAINKDTERMLRYHRYLPFDDYIKNTMQTVCLYIDGNGNYMLCSVCDTDDIIEYFINRRDNCKCRRLNADYLSNNEMWNKTLREIDMQDCITGILEVKTIIGTNYIALYDGMMR